MLYHYLLKNSLCVPKVLTFSLQSLVVHIKLIVISSLLSVPLFSFLLLNLSYVSVIFTDSFAPPFIVVVEPIFFFVSTAIVAFVFITLLIVVSTVILSSFFRPHLAVFFSRLTTSFFQLVVPFIVAAAPFISFFCLPLIFFSSAVPIVFSAITPIVLSLIPQLLIRFSSFAQRAHELSEVSKSSLILNHFSGALSL
jgi:hypothetical protein